jgi:SAM-dependent methyltransferase
MSEHHAKRLVNREAAERAEELLEGYLTAHFALFKPLTPTMPMDVLIPWFAFRIGLIFKEGGTFVDLGGGLNVSNAVLTDMGMDVYVVDLLEEYYPGSVLGSEGHEQIAFLKSRGVRFIRANLADYNLQTNFVAESVDSIGSYHVLEHLHQPPRVLLYHAVATLKPGGVLLLEVPNAINLLKRFKVVAGKTNLPPYLESFDAEHHWRGHVREYSVGDLTQLAARLDMSYSVVLGKNWYGSLYSKIRSRRVAGALDHLLSYYPGLCGSLFLYGIK